MFKKRILRLYWRLWVSVSVFKPYVIWQKISGAWSFLLSFFFLITERHLLTLELNAQVICAVLETGRPALPVSYEISHCEKWDFLWNVTTQHNETLYYSTEGMIRLRLFLLTVMKKNRKIGFLGRESHCLEHISESVRPWVKNTGRNWNCH